MRVLIFHRHAGHRKISILVLGFRKIEWVGLGVIPPCTWKGAMYMPKQGLVRYLCARCTQSIPRGALIFSPPPGAITLFVR